MRKHLEINFATLGVVIVLGSLLIVTTIQAQAQPPKLGRVLTDSELREIPSHVFPDGTGLPQGSGSSATGKALYLQQCAGCHGGQGEGGTAMELIGDRESLTTEYPDRGIAVLWPYAPTLFEYIRRTMPPDNPWSLNVNQVYAVTAYLLELNELIEPGTVMDQNALPAIKMPNRDGFVDPHDQ